jgi:hypothetical protein
MEYGKMGGYPVLQHIKNYYQYLSFLISWLILLTKPGPS